jgi:hypothetical protein
MAYGSFTNNEAPNLTPYETIHAVLTSKVIKQSMVQKLDANGKYAFDNVSIGEYQLTINVAGIDAQIIGLSVDTLSESINFTLILATTLFP